MITISQFSKERIVSLLHCDPDKVHVIYCGISDTFRRAGDISEAECEKVRQKYSLPPGYFLCLSTLEPRKKYAASAAGVSGAAGRGKTQPGSGAGRKEGWKIENLLQQIQKEHEMEKSDDNDMPGVQMTGFVDEEDLPVLYQMADCFVFPSLYEGFGIPPLEAMQMGTVVISSDAPAMKEVLGDGAYYFQNNNKEI